VDRRIERSDARVRFLLRLWRAAVLRWIAHPCPALRLGQLLTRALPARSRELADNPPLRQDKKV